MPRARQHCDRLLTQCRGTSAGNQKRLQNDRIRKKQCVNSKHRMTLINALSFFIDNNTDVASDAMRDIMRLPLVHCCELQCEGSEK
jgi:hypothetical protein